MAPRVTPLAPHETSAATVATLLTTMKLATCILAAGLGTRMKSSRAKVLHAVAGRAMIEYPVGLARAVGAERIVCVLGHQANAVQAAIEARFGAGAVDVALQPEQRGTGHAVLQAAPQLADFAGSVLILCGDVPLLTEATVRRLVEVSADDTLAFVTLQQADPRGYGRIVRDGVGQVLRIVEERDCTPEECKISECNSGIYCVPAKFLFESLALVRPNNAQGELYLTDVVARAAERLKVVVVEASAEEVMGINDRVELSRADAIMRWRLVRALMHGGVTIVAPESVIVEPGVTVGADSELGPGVELRGTTRVGQGCKIARGVVLVDSVVGDGVRIKPYCVITESTIGDRAELGPFAHLRPGSVLEEGVHLGNFVETKKTRLGKGAKANHLSYLGDADIGAGVNVGCGTITCNYDGYDKYQTIIEEGAFIGSDTQLVAPVRVGKGAVVAAGTTVHRDVPAGALALTRTEQVHIEGYAEKKRQRMAAAGLPKKK